jgi:restriction endonuclease Mrr
VVAVTADTDAVFETSVGVIHRINNRTRFVVHAERGHPQVADEDVATLVTENFHAAVDLEADQFGAVFDDVKERRFGQTQTKYKEWAVERPRDYHTTTVTYTGDNNVTYDRTGEPKHSDISVQPIEPVYLTEVRQTTHLQECTYPYEYCAAGPSRVTRQNGIVDSVATFAGITYRSPLPRSARTNTGGSSSVYVPRPRVAFRSHLHVEFVDLNQAFEP